MFSNKRVVTCGISNDLSPILQAVLWALIDEMNVPQKDYFQVFKLSGIGDEQVIVHSQEHPEYRKEHRMKLCGGSIFVGKIFVIDDGDHSTMLKANEY